MGLPILDSIDAVTGAGTATLDAFGVFDGHGGKQAAIFASKHMTATMLEELRKQIGDGPSAEQKGILIPLKQLAEDGCSGMLPAH
jgi:serine/threonine protein phosphatase PrpC